jgi:nitrogen fixation protein FixH
MPRKTVKVPTVVQVQVTFRDEAGALVDPLAVVAEVQRPDRVVETRGLFDMTRQSLGIYRLPVDVTLPGSWDVSFTASGNISVAGDVSFFAVQRNTRS